jgi:pyruvate kinase
MLPSAGDFLSGGEKMQKNKQRHAADTWDAAMGERAECVMLDKGPHITEAM